MIGPIPPPNGGMAMQTRQLADCFAREGIAVTLLAVNPPYSPKWVSKIRGLRALFRLVPYIARLWESAGSAHVFLVMANSGWSWHLFAAPAIWIGSWRGMPVIVNYRGGEAAAFLNRQFRWVVPSLRRATRIIVPSRYLQDVFARFGVVAEIIPNCVNTDVFHPSPRAIAPTAAPRILVARHLEPIYDIGTAIRAFTLVKKQIPKAELHIAGDGPERQNLIELAQSLSLAASVRFHGNLERHAMADLIRTADVLLNPSREDNMPNSLLEAMASGVPIVTTDAGGIPHMIQNEMNGLIVSRADPQAMATGVLRVLQDEGLRKRLISAGLALTFQLTWQEIRRPWMSLFQALSSSGRRPPES